MRISHLILLSFTFILLLFATTTYINYRQTQQVKANAQYAEQSTTIIQKSNRFQRNILNMVSGLRGFLLTGESFFLQAYDSAALENATIINELKAAIPDTSYRQRILNEAEQLNNRWLNEFATPLRQAKINAEASYVNEPYFNRLYKEKMFISEESKLNILLQQKIRAFINSEYAERSQRSRRLSTSVQHTSSVSLTLTVLSFALGFFIVSFLAYRISKRILKMVHMADSIAAGNYRVHTEETGQDELSKLARSLNHMAKVLDYNINELKKKNGELDQFAHVVSHDLKAPLRGIDNVVNWIKEDHQEELSPKLAEYMELISGRVTRGENLIQGLLTYARVGKDEQKKEAVDLTLLVQEILENYPLKKAFTITIDPALPVLHTHRLPLFQVFSNLIGNAIKYNNKEKGELKIWHKKHPKHYEFFIEDNGPGINRNYHEKIFAIFQTLQERDSFESTGVGLAIVKKILDARTEEIWLVSEPGQGTTFSFTWKNDN